MGDQDTGQKSVEQQDQDSDNTQDRDSDNKPERAGQLAEKPEVNDSHREKAKEMAKAYDDDITTAVLPGSDGSVTGTAVNEWLDDEGNPKFGREDAKEGKEDTGNGAEEDANDRATGDAKDEANAGSADDAKAERSSDGGGAG